MKIKDAEKIKISLTDFIEFVSKVGTTKFTKVKEIKNRDPYHPNKDFWKALRDGIVDIHKHSLNKKKLDEVVNGLKDENKIKLYPHVIKQYQSFLGRKKTEFINPPNEDWIYGDIQVKLNPEIGLFIDDKPYIIKLYFKAEPLSKSKIDLIILMMNKYLRKGDYSEANFAVLDVCKKKLYETSKLDDRHLSLLEGECLSFSQMWNSI